MEFKKTLKKLVKTLKKLIKPLKKITSWLSDPLNAFMLIITIATLGGYFTFFNERFSPYQNDWGLFGDYLGGVLGTLISLIAVLLIHRTYKLQQDLFDLQGEELTNTTEAFNQQNKYIQEQQFENIVFRLLDRRDKLLSEINYQQHVGIEALINFHSRHDLLKKRKDVQTFKDHFDQNITKFLPYFLSFVSTVNYMDSFKPTPPGKNYDLKKQLFDEYWSVQNWMILRT